MYTCTCVHTRLSNLPPPLTYSREPLISGGKYRVEDEQFTASSSYSQGYLRHEARLGGNRGVQKKVVIQEAGFKLISEQMS